MSNNTYIKWSQLHWLFNEFTFTERNLPEAGIWSPDPRIDSPIRKTDVKSVTYTTKNAEKTSDDPDEISYMRISEHGPKYKSKDLFRVFKKEQNLAVFKEDNPLLCLEPDILIPVNGKSITLFSEGYQHVEITFNIEGDIVTFIKNIETDEQMRIKTGLISWSALCDLINGRGFTVRVVDETVGPIKFTDELFVKPNPERLVVRSLVKISPPEFTYIASPESLKNVKLSFGHSFLQFNDKITPRWDCTPCLPVRGDKVIVVSDENVVYELRFIGVDIIRVLSSMINPSLFVKEEKWADPLPCNVPPRYRNLPACVIAYNLKGFAELQKTQTRVDKKSSDASAEAKGDVMTEEMAEAVVNDIEADATTPVAKKLTGRSCKFCETKNLGRPSPSFISHGQLSELFEKGKVIDRYLGDRGTVNDKLKTWEGILDMWEERKKIFGKFREMKAEMSGISLTVDSKKRSDYLISYECDDVEFSKVEISTTKNAETFGVVLETNQASAPLAFPCVENRVFVLDENDCLRELEFESVGGWTSVATESTIQQIIEEDAPKIAARRKKIDDMIHEKYPELDVVEKVNKPFSLSSELAEIQKMQPSEEPEPEDPNEAEKIKVFVPRPIEAMLLTSEINIGPEVVKNIKWRVEYEIKSDKQKQAVEAYKRLMEKDPSLIEELTERFVSEMSHEIYIRYDGTKLTPDRIERRLVDLAELGFVIDLTIKNGYDIFIPRTGSLS